MGVTNSRKLTDRTNQSRCGPWYSKRRNLLPAGKHERKYRIVITSVYLPALRPPFPHSAHLRTRRHHCWNIYTRLSPPCSPRCRRLRGAPARRPARSRCRARTRWPRHSGRYARAGPGEPERAFTVSLPGTEAAISFSVRLRDVLYVSGSGIRLLPRSHCSVCSRAAGRTVPMAAARRADFRRRSPRPPTGPSP